MKSIKKLETNPNLNRTNNHTPRSSCVVASYQSFRVFEYTNSSRRRGVVDRARVHFTTRVRGPYSN